MNECVQYMCRGRYNVHVNPQDLDSKLTLAVQICILSYNSYKYNECN